MIQKEQTPIQEVIEHVDDLIHGIKENLEPFDKLPTIMKTTIIASLEALKKEPLIPLIEREKKLLIEVYQEGWKNELPFIDMEKWYNEKFGNNDNSGK